MHGRKTTETALRAAASILIAALLCLGILSGMVCAASEAAETDTEKRALAARLDKSHYPPGSFKPGEVVVVLETPSLQDLGSLIGEFAAILAGDAGEALSEFVASRRKTAIRLRLRPGQDELEAARKLMASPLVRAAEPNIVFSVCATEPNDALYDEQWNLSGAFGVNAGEAWDMQQGSPGMTLAVIDTGLEYTHEDLSGRHSGGWDYFNNDPDPWDDNGHGTMVSGMACANTDNGIGIAGLDWQARIMPLKALGSDGEGYLDSVVSSIYHAATNGADVINMSLTSSIYSQELADAVEFAISMGCVLTAAVGNEGDARVNYPAGITGVIGVGSVGMDGSRSWFSNRNSSVDIVAPGERIYGTMLNDDYQFGAGTSEATPHVSAAALLVLAEYPGSTPDEVWRRLRDSARDLGSPGYDEEYGWGLLDASGALRVPLVTVTYPLDYSYPASGKVSAAAASTNTTVKYLEFHLDGALIESYSEPVPGFNSSHEFTSWDLSQLAEGTHIITVKAIDPGGTWEGEHAVTVYNNRSQPRPSRDWYLAEGSTAWGFETYVLIQNPNPTPAEVQVDFMKPGGATQGHSYVMGGNSRLTIAVNSLVSASDVSTHVRADVPVVAERAMYWGGRRGGHVAVGSNSLGSDWYLAEGSTAWGFETYVLVQNPNPTPAAVRATFMRPDGSTQQYDFSTAAFSRLTLPLNDLVGSSDASTRIQSDVPVVVERAMYWNGRDGGHATLGVAGGCNTWYLAEGCTDYGFETWVLVQNPNDVPASVTFSFMRPDGSVVRAVRTAGPRSRLTLNMAESVPGSEVSTYVRSEQPVIVERAMYWPRGSRARAGGHGSSGSLTASREWYLAEGTTAWGFEEFVLLLNPTERVAHATLRFMRNDGSSLDYQVKLGAYERATVTAGEVDPGRDVSVQVTSDTPLVVERAMYWSEREGGSAALGALNP